MHSESAVFLPVISCYLPIRQIITVRKFCSDSRSKSNQIKPGIACIQLKLRQQQKEIVTQTQSKCHKSYS